jgi:hypothetical protein
LRLPISQVVSQKDDHGPCVRVEAQSFRGLHHQDINANISNNVEARAFLSRWRARDQRLNQGHRRRSYTSSYQELLHGREVIGVKILVNVNVNSSVETHNEK